MAQVPDFPFVLHGGDYNPEQWPTEIWPEDVALMKKAGVNIATLPVFGWGNIQTDEDTWNFEWLDRVIELLHAGGIRLCLATATAATPPWVDQKYPDILRVGPDGRRVRHGGRHTFCPHSANFRRLSVGLARKMAERYADHPALMIWHISNEYGNKCYCDQCSAAFRTWLQARYGTLAEANFRWNMAFWGQTFTDWSQIEAPVQGAQRNFQGLLIDYDRFQSESILDACRAEIAAVREFSRDVPITTNMMGTFKPLDYHAWAKELDIVSWDSYPGRGEPPHSMAFSHSLMRGLKGGAPWMLMEQTPSQQNWQRYNSLKRPGILRLWSYQAMAHGADAVMYFQWRRSPGAQEMFHGAVVEHANNPEARVFREVAALGEELKALGTTTVGTQVQSEAAILFDWDTWWAVDYSSGPSVDMNYVGVAKKYAEAFYARGISFDVVPVDADLSGYSVVAAPMLKMVKPGVAERLTEFVERGGNLITSYFSGIVDETDRAFANGYPGPLSELLGIWVEETDALSPDMANRAIYADGEVAACGIICDRIQLRGAEALAHYGDDFYAGEPVITQNRLGQGTAVYVGSDLLGSPLASLLARLFPTMGREKPADVEYLIRRDAGREIHFVLNHGLEPAKVAVAGSFRDLLTQRTVSDEVALEKYGVAILLRV